MARTPDKTDRMTPAAEQRLAQLGAAAPLLVRPHILDLIEGAHTLTENFDHLNTRIGQALYAVMGEPVVRDTETVNGSSFSAAAGQLGELVDRLRLIERHLDLLRDHVERLERL
jgi:hypothetical protein